jgi:hypothetical protein
MGCGMSLVMQAIGDDFPTRARGPACSILRESRMIPSALSYKTKKDSVRETPLINGKRRSCCVKPDEGDQL